MPEIIRMPDSPTIALNRGARLRGVREALETATAAQQEHLFLAPNSPGGVRYPPNERIHTSPHVTSNVGRAMIDEEIASLLEDAGYRFVPESIRYQAVTGADDNIL